MMTFVKGNIVYFYLIFIFQAFTLAAPAIGTTVGIANTGAQTGTNVNQGKLCVTFGVWMEGLFPLVFKSVVEM